MTRKLTLIQDEDTDFWYIKERTGFSYVNLSNQATTKLVVPPETEKCAWNLYAIPENKQAPNYKTMIKQRVAKRKKETGVSLSEKVTRP